MTRELERRGGKDRRKGRDRRSGEERRRSQRADDPRDLYQSDLDRHFWSWPIPSGRKRKRRRRLKLAGVIASAAGLLGAAGISYFFYRRRHDEATAQTDAEEDRGKVVHPEEAEGADD